MNLECGGHAAALAGREIYFYLPRSMRLLDGQLVLSPSDLTKFTRCEHATTLDLGDLDGTLEKLAGKRRSLHTDFIVRKGTEYEEDYIEKLARAGNRLIPIKSERKTREDLVNAEAATLDAMRVGADYIYQAVFFDGKWVGYADLLQKVPTPSSLGGWSYEVVDTKLARSPKAHFLLQLASYSEQLARVQGVKPAKMHVVLGTGQTASFRVADFEAYFRYIKRRFEERIGVIPSRADGEESPAQVRKSIVPPGPGDPSLTLGMTPDAPLHRRLLLALRVEPPLLAPPREARPSRPRGEHQKRSCAKTRRARRHDTHEARRDTAGAGSEGQRRDLRHTSSAGSVTSGADQNQATPLRAAAARERPRLRAATETVARRRFLDLEADPYAGEGITYLFGTAHDATYTAWWADDALEQQKAFEAVIDFIAARWREHPVTW